MHRFARAYLGAVALLTLTSSPLLAADHVTLVNGDSLTGRLERADGKEVVFESDLVGRVTIKWPSVRQLTSDATLTVERLSGEQVAGKLAVDGATIAVMRSDGSRVGVPLNNIRSIGTALPGSGTWGGSFDGNLALSRGNTDTLTVAAMTTATRSSRGQKIGTYATLIYSDIGIGADRTTLARTTRGGVRLDRDVAGPAFVFGFGDLENDPLQLLDLRTVVGGGGGLHLVNNGRTQLNAFGGVSFAHDKYTEVITVIEPATTTTTTTTTTTPPASTTNPGNSANAPGRAVTVGKNKTIVISTRTPPVIVRTTGARDVGEFVFGQDLWSQLTDRFSVTERLTFFPAMEDVHDYRISFDLSLFAQLSDRWQWNISASDRYLRIPPSGGAVSNDLFISSGLGVSFGKGGGGGYTGADVRPR
jgi:hypothetical protein